MFAVTDSYVASFFVSIIDDFETFVCSFLSMRSFQLVMIFELYYITFNILVMVAYCILLLLLISNN